MVNSLASELGVWASAQPAVQPNPSRNLFDFYETRDVWPCARGDQLLIEVKVCKGFG